MDAIQRPLRRSPYTVPGRTSIGDTPDESGIAQQVLLAKRVAGRLAVFLRKQERRKCSKAQKEAKSESSKSPAHGGILQSVYVMSENILSDNLPAPMEQVNQNSGIY